MNKDDAPIIIEQLFNYSPQIVWKAITELSEMKQWFFENIPSFKPEVGFKTKFIIENEGRVFPHLWEIVEVIPNKKIVYNWKYDGYTGDSNVEFELFEEGNSTRLQLRTIILENFSEDIPEFKRESCIGGWNYFIKKQLVEYLANAK